MPLFGKKHKSPRRKLEAGASNTLKTTLNLSKNDDPNDTSVKLKLGGNELVFQDGEWFSGNKTQSMCTELVLVCLPIFNYKKVLRRRIKA